MELPFNYIVFYLMCILKSRKMPMVIEKVNLLISVKKLVDLLSYDEDEREEIINEFDFNEEINNLVREYNDYIDADNEQIILEIDDEILEEIMESFELEYNKEILDDIHSAINDNFVFLELIGVKINKDIFNNLLNLERNIEKMYEQLSNGQFDKQLIHKLKLSILKRKMLFSVTENTLDCDEYYDLYLYSLNCAINSDDDAPIHFEIEDEELDVYQFAKNPMLKALFYKEELALYNLANRMDITILKRTGEYDFIEVSKLKFYLTFLKHLDNEISKKDINTLLKEELIISKYRLKNALDTVYDTLTIIDNKDYININELSLKEDYSFIENIILYFTNEVLEYSNDRYEYDDKDFFNLTNYYFNIIKKLLIKTYYTLTDDKRIVDIIKSNKMYKINNISSNLLDDAIEQSKNKKKIK
ncbi:MAG: hypothetical protein IJZ46_02575 [Bacilli bacterium]|nr:hypothetical protein [Bacilli bacterium]